MIVKFVAFCLCAMLLVLSVGCAAGFVALESAGLYVNGLDELQDLAYESIARTIADSYGKLYAAQTLGKLPYTLRESMYDDPLDRSDADHWFVRVYQDGQKLAEAGSVHSDSAYIRSFRVAPLYAIASLYGPDDMQEDTQTPGPTNPEGGEQQERNSVFPELRVPDDYLYFTQERVFQGGEVINYYLYYYQAPEYAVTVYMNEEVLESSSMHMLEMIYPMRHMFIAVLVAGLLLAAACLVYLLIAAGYAPDGTIRPGGLNRMSLDFYGAAVAGAMYGLFTLLWYQWHWVQDGGPHPGNLSLIAVNLMAVAVIGLAYITAITAQIKMGQGYWWKNSILYRSGKVFSLVFNKLGKGLSALGKMLPLMWKWLVVAGVLAVSFIACFLFMIAAPEGSIAARIWTVVFFLVTVICIAVLLYAGYCLAVLIEGAWQMRQGDLSRKIPTKVLRGTFLEFAQHLNALSETAYVAAKKQMHSERMKSELITNVSHDIKTPLTSIINYVDLLRKAHSQQQEQEYMEVLQRQSERMKKLIDDLMELSKASSGSISVNLQTLDAQESVNQALGEFSDKLDAAGIEPVFQIPETPMYMTADGRLVWRVLSNLLNNAVKYALPGTRLYVELQQEEGNVLLSLKNISKLPLNVGAEDLLERFVRGDSSRNSEGSGLGLNIAKNLMEVQNGQLQLQLDGDLFKVMLLFPGAEAESR